MARGAQRRHGEVIEGRVRDIAHGGDAVVETARGIVMVRGPLPGESVRLRLQQRRGGVARGELLQVQQASADRVEPACPLTERCGGCPLMALQPAAQLELKRAHLERALGDGATGTLEMTASPIQLGYRGRARLAFQRRGDGTTLGYRSAASRKLVDVERCAILSGALQAGLDALRAELAPRLQGSGELSLGSGRGERAVLHLSSEQLQPPEVYRAAEALVERGELAGIALAIAGAAPAIIGEPRQQTRTADGQPLWAAPGGFAQANPAVNAALVEHAVALAEPEGAQVLELYAGHGNFTVELARHASKVAAIESDRAASEACRENLAARGLAERVRVSCEDAAAAVARGGGPLDVVLLDPPRSGAREVMPALVARKPRRIVYVSCDPATLRRDLSPLQEAGYRIDAARGFDMFPHTPHVEAVVRLSR